MFGGNIFRLIEDENRNKMTTGQRTSQVWRPVCPGPGIVPSLSDSISTSPHPLSLHQSLLLHYSIAAATSSDCMCDVPELLREGERGCAEGQGGRGQLRQVQVAAALLQVLRGLQILRSFT